MNVSVHKCFGQVKSFSVFSLAKDHCCEPVEKKSCCSTEVFQLPDDTADKLLTSNAFDLSIPFAGLVECPDFEIDPNVENEHPGYLLSDSSPPDRPHYLMNCAFTFYG